MATASAEEVAELLGDRADESIVDRIVSVGASIDEISEAIEDVEYQLEYGAEREASSPKVDELRTILEEIFEREEPLPRGSDDEGDEHEGLTIVDAEELGRESQ